MIATSGSISMSTCEPPNTMKLKRLPPIALNAAPGPRWNGGKGIDTPHLGRDIGAAGAGYPNNSLLQLTIAGGRFERQQQAAAGCAKCSAAQGCCPARHPYADCPQGIMTAIGRHPLP